MSEYLTVAEAAKRVRASKSLIQVRCKDGEIPAIRVGRSYRILIRDLDAWVSHNPQREPRVTVQVDKNLIQYIDGWYHYMKAVKNYTPDTLSTHQKHIRNYLRRLTSRGKPCNRVEDLFNRQSMLAVLMALEGKSYYSKLNTYCAVTTFGAFLVESHVVSGEIIQNLKSLKPRQHAEPRRTHLLPNQVGHFFDAVLTRNSLARDNVGVAAVFGCMVYSGLRASEVCKLTVNDLDLENRTITVRLGKGGKTRRVGIPAALLTLIRNYLATRAIDNNHLFVDLSGDPYDRNKLGKKMKSISRDIGIDITCHGLRRTFATLAANQGRSLNAIRIALGHSKLETTQLYLLTSESEVVESMKGW